MRKQLDNRIPTLINNGVKKNHRSFIVLVGDRGRDQIVNLHFLLSQARVSARPSVLWCYKKELGFTTHRKKREAKIKRDIKRGIREPNEQDPFEIFVTVTDIRYTYYKESQKILGNTYGMCVLQDFEAVTPNVLARTIETVEGGGLVVLLLKTMTSLRQLYTLTMDVHARYRTASHNAVIARFNERFILSLGSCDDCLVLDDELNVLPISRGKDILPLAGSPVSASASALRQDDKDLKDLKSSLEDVKPAGDLIKLAKTIDQAKAILTFIDAISEKTLSSTVTLTAARGRGKSAALGLAVAAALAHGYANIFVTSPSPENLKTLFGFVFKGLDALGYEEHLEYDVVQSVNPEFGGAVVRVNVFREHRQTIQYIQPEDAHVLGQAELVIIDEAAAIPLPLVKNLLGPYLVFMASTINGYEGTGRSLSLKLIQQLRDSTRPSLAKDAPGEGEDAGKKSSTSSSSSSNKALVKAAPKTRTLREITLSTPIRYSAGDKVEKWLNALLCLDASSSSVPRSLAGPTTGPTGAGCPHPDLCDLYWVNRDTLFSYHPASEVFLQRMMALYVASHYKNQPNDLQLMSDAPAHHLFVLLPPIGSQTASSSTSTSTLEPRTHLPEPLVVVQVALEGGLGKEVIMEGLGRGVRAGGDMVPWVVGQQFLEGGFGSLGGARVVRVACAPEVGNMGYGTRAIKALNSYYSGEYFNLDEAEESEKMEGVEEEEEEDHHQATDLLHDEIKVKSINKMPPLLQRLSERKPEAVDYLGVSYGMTGGLLRFWKRLGFVPLYVRQTPSELTGEHTCVMVRGLNSSSEGEVEWVGEFAKDFRKRFLSLLSYRFREFGSVLALSVLEAASKGVMREGDGEDLDAKELGFILTPFDLKRLDAYANNMLDYHVVMDLMPTLGALYFQRRLGGRSTARKGAQGGEEGGERKEVRLSAMQSSLLLAVGVQRKSVEDVERELQIPVSQGLALLVKIVRKITNRLVAIQREAVSREVPDISASAANALSRVAEIGTRDKPATVAIREELDEAGDEATRKLREKQREMISSLDLRKYTIDGAGVDWGAAEEQVKNIAKGGAKASTIVSVKSAGSGGVKRKAEDSAVREGGSGGKSGGDDKKKTRRGSGGKKVKR